MRGEENPPPCLYTAWLLQLYDRKKEMSIARLVNRGQVDSHKVLMVKNGTLG
jgi:hypothetical protein